MHLHNIFLFEIELLIRTTSARNSDKFSDNVSLTSPSELYFNVAETLRTLYGSCLSTPVVMCPLGSLRVGHQQ